jgi:hypothetical protein
VTNKDTIAAGNSIGTLSVQGSLAFDAGSTLETEVNAAGQNDLVAVTGGATINGGTVSVLAASGSYATSTQYTIVSTTAGRTGTFSGVIGLVVTLQVLGMPGPATLGPGWMTKVLGLSEAQFGFMAMTWGLSTFFASFFFVFRKDVSSSGRTLCIAVIGFAVCAVVFGHSRSVPLTAVANFGLGMCMVGTMVTANTIVQQNVSDAMRGRVMGLFPLAMGLSMLGGLPVGAAGQIYGLPVVLPLLAWATVAATGAIILWRPGIRRVGRIRPPTPAPAPSAGG